MPNNLVIGGLNFGVGVDTEGLEYGLEKLEEFRDKVDEVADAQKKNNEGAATAYAKQERSIKRALEQVKNLKQALRQNDAPPDMVKAANKAFNTLTTEMTEGARTATEYGRSIDAFNTRLGNVKRNLNDLKFEKKGKEVGTFAAMMKELQTSTILAVGPLSGIGARFAALRALAEATNFALAGTVAGVIGLGVGLGKLSVSAVETTAKFEQMEARFSVATGSFTKAKDEMDFTISISKRLGLNLDSTASAYSRLVAASANTTLQGKKTRDVFVGISDAAAALGMNSEQVQGSLVALEQMISKGTVQSQELRIQLGNQLPGAFQIAARAMGVTTAALENMLKSGSLTADVFLPRFAAELQKEFGPIAQENLQRYSGVWANFGTSVELTAKAFGDLSGVNTFVKSFIQDLTHTLNNVAAAFKEAAKEKDAFFQSVDNGGSGTKQGYLAAVVTTMDEQIRSFKSALGYNVKAGDFAKQLAEAKIELSSIAAQLDTIPESAKNAGNPLVQSFEKAKQKVNELQKAVDKINSSANPKTFDFNNLPDFVSSISDSKQQPSPNVDKVVDSLKQIRQQTDELTASTAKMKGGLAPDFADAYTQAQKLLKTLRSFDTSTNKIDVTQATLDSLQKSLEELGFTGPATLKNVTSELEEFISKQKQAESENNKQRNAFDRNAKVIADITQRTKELKAANEDLQKTPGITSSVVDRQLQAQKTLSAIKKELASTSLAPAKQDELFNDFASAFKENNFLKPVHDASAAVQGYVDQIASAKKNIQQLKETSSKGLFDPTAFRQANDIVSKLADDQLPDLQKKLESLQGFSFSGPASRNNIIDELTKLISTTDATNKSWTDLLAAMDRTPKTFADLDAAIDDLQKKDAALRKGPRAVQLFNLQDQNARTLQRFKDQLLTLPKGSEKYNELSQEISKYNSLLTDTAKLQENLKNTSVDMASAITQGIDDAIFSGNKFADVLDSLGKKMLEIVLQDEVLKPFSNFISGALEGIGGGRGGGGFSGGFGLGGDNASLGVGSGAALAAKGMAWMNGIRMLANGGLLNQPTLFSTKSGLAIGGEAGTEAVMPLTRTAGGKLGVYSAGGGGVQINIIDQRTNKDSSPVDVQEKQGADGVRRIQVLIRDTVKGMHNSGEMDRTMASNYGVARKGVR